MLLSVTPNVCVERMLRLSDFKVGGVHRVASSSILEAAGGKGVNAARVAAHLGAQVTATGWIGRDREEWLRQELEREGVNSAFVTVETPTRVATNILSGDSPVVSTELIESGHALSIEDGTRLLHRFESLLPDAQMCVVGGSYPPAASGSERAFEAFSALLVRTASRFNVPVLLDGRGRAFEVAVRGKPSPWAIKPNVEEARDLLKRDIASPADEKRAVLELLRLGPRVVLLSCGARGCYVGMERAVWFLPSPPVELVSAVGGGDSLVGAFAARYLATPEMNERERVLEAARWGVAAGVANACRTDAANVSREEVESLLPQVRVQSLVMALMA